MLAAVQHEQDVRVGEQPDDLLKGIGLGRQSERRCESMSCLRVPLPLAFFST
jgi:hypothetical protein